MTAGCGVELQHPAVAYGVRVRSRLGTASSPPCSTRPSVGRPTFRPCPRRSSTFAASWALKSTGRWESLARTRRDMQPRHAQLGVLPRAAGRHCLHAPGPRPADALSVGMFLQTLLLALTERGLGSCVEVSIAGYPEIVRAQLAIPAELSILCGLAVGYPDPDFPANKLHIGREPHRRRTWCSSTTDPGEQLARLTDNRRGIRDDPKAEPLQGSARGDEGVGGRSRITCRRAGSTIR